MLRTGRSSVASFGAMSEPPGLGLTARLGPWAVAALVMLCLEALYTETSRFEGPIGEKYLATIIQPGGADFVNAFNGSLALLRGVNPYDHRVDDLADPLGREAIIPGRWYNTIYLPTHLATYVPLAIATGGGRRRAVHVWFALNLVWLVGLSAVTAKLLADVKREPFDPLLALVLLFVFAASPPVQLLLERGQSDLFTALLVWGGLLLALRDRWFAATFFVTWALLMKGYPVLVLAGLGLFGLRRRMRPTIAGVLTALIVLLLPVVRYLPVGLEAARARSQLFMNTWYNHSFQNLVYELAPDQARAGARALTGLGLIATLLCGLAAWRAAKRGEPNASWSVLFTVVALATMLGFSGVSHTYNLILILPGAVVAALGQREIARAARFERADALIGIALLLALTPLVIVKTGSATFPLASLGLVGVILIGFTLAAYTLVASSKR